MIFIQSKRQKVEMNCVGIKKGEDWTIGEKCLMRIFHVNCWYKNEIVTNLKEIEKKGEE
jgi:hypothetical protein